MSKVLRVYAIAIGLALSQFCGAALATTKWEQFSQAAEKAYSGRNFTEAEKNFLQALKEAEKFDKSDKRLATTVYNLALIYQQEEKYDESEATYRRALELLTGIYGVEHERAGQVHIDLGDLYRARADADDDAKKGWRSKAAAEYQLAVDVLEVVYEKSKKTVPIKPEKEKSSAEQTVKPTPPITRKEASELLARTLNNYADFYADEDDFAPAEPLYQKAIDIEAAELGLDNKKLGQDKAHFAEFFCVQGKYQPAEPLFKDALRIIEKNSGAESMELARVQYNAGGLYYDQGAFPQAEELFTHALKVFEKDSSIKPTDIALKSIALADVFDMQGKTNDAHSMYKKSIAALEKENDPNPNALMSALKQYQKHLLMMNDKVEASKVSARIKELKGGNKAP